MWIKSWEFVSVVSAAVWCFGLSVVGVAQFSDATHQPVIPPTVFIIGWSQPESSSPSPEDDIARRVEVTISPPFDVATPVKLRTKWNDTVIHFARTVPAGEKQFLIGFDLGVRSNLYADEVVECTVQTVLGQDVKQPVHLARFPGMPNNATLHASAGYLQGGVQETLKIHLELQGRVQEDLEFPLTLEPDKGLVVLDSKSLLVRKGQRFSDPVEVKVINTKVNHQLTAVATKPKGGGIEMREDSIDIELLAKPRPIVSAKLAKATLAEGMSTTLTFSLEMPNDEDIPLSIQLPVEHQSDVEMSENQTVILKGELSVSLELLAVVDNVIREPDENISLKFLSEADIKLNEKLDLIVKDTGKLEIILDADVDAILSEDADHQTVQIGLALAGDAIAGSDIVIPCRVTANGATVATGKGQGGDDVLVSGIGQDNARRLFNAANSVGEAVIKEGQNAASIKLLAVDDRIFMEEESVAIDFELNEGEKFVDSDGVEVPSTLSYEIQDNDTTLLKPIENLALAEGTPLKGNQIGIATVECDIEKAQTFSFVVAPDSTAKQGEDYDLPTRNTVTLEPGDQVLSLPITIVDDDIPEAAKELHLLFDDPEIGSLKISLSDDDDPNALEDVGETLFLLIANGELANDWTQRKAECIALLKLQQKPWLVSNSVFVVGTKQNQVAWDRLDSERIKDYRIQDVKFGTDSNLPSQLYAVASAWDEIVGRLNGRVPQNVVVAWFNGLSAPDLGPLKAKPFKLKGRGDGHILSFVWYGGIVQGAQPIRFLSVGGTGLESKVRYREEKSKLMPDVQPTAVAGQGGKPRAGGQ